MPPFKSSYHDEWKWKQRRETQAKAPVVSLLLNIEVLPNILSPDRLGYSCLLGTLLHPALIQPQVWYPHDLAYNSSSIAVLHWFQNISLTAAIFRFFVS